MSKRLQVVMDEAELRRVQKAARAKGLTVAEWVRLALRKAGGDAAAGNADRKLAAVRRAVRHQFPAPDIGQMLDEIARGYGAGNDE